MEIRSYPQSSPSFGMALKKPTADQIENFVEFAMGGQKGPISTTVKRGLKQIRRQQAKNPHFDMVFKEGGMYVVPKSQEAKVYFKYPEFKIGEKALMPKDIRISKVNENLAEVEKIASPLKKSVAKAFYTVQKALIKAENTIFRPKDAVSDGIRYAAEVATKKSNEVSGRIANIKAVDSIFK